MISAIILAAGESRRMGQPKMLLPWGPRTVIEHVVTMFLSAGINDVLIVTGGARKQVENILEGYPVQRVHNANYAAGEMLSSLQLGLQTLPDRALATLIALGDQPQVQERSIRLLCEVYRKNQSQLVVPSFQRRRGHPWLVARPLWNEILALEPRESPRDFLNRHAAEIHYVEAKTPTILADLDTPEDYRNAHP